MINIIDYGLGNIQAFVTMYKRLGVEAKPAKTANDLVGTKKIILPGVGAFDHAMELLNSSGMRQPLENLIIQDRIPVLGICVGMQILAQSSDEGVKPGLGWINGSVKRFSSNNFTKSLPMPHMGWNDVHPMNNSPIFDGLHQDARFYFLHSYYFDCSDSTDISATTEYGFPFHCAIQKDNIFGVQFHPEKSHHWGATLLKNFADF